MAAQAITPQYSVEEVAAVDLIGGLQTISGRSGEGTTLPPPGKGPDEPLAWAIQDVSAAARNQDKSEVSKLCTNSVTNSRRALGCLVDWYLQRDFAIYCKHPPASAKQKAEFLMQRGVIDELTSRVLERAVGKRNRVEHDFHVPTLSEAEDMVDLLRRTINSLRTSSDPGLAPMVYGIYLFSRSGRTDNMRIEFNGWVEPLVVFNRFAPRPWVSVIIPESNTKALLRKAYLDGVFTEELIQILFLAQQKFGSPGGYHGIQSCPAILEGIGLA